MSRRWTIWFAALLLLSILALVPLRIAVAGLADHGFTARQVAGTIWYGRIGELSLRGRSLGTFEVRLDPGPLLIGSLELGFHRMDDPQGALDGTVVTGSAHGIRSASGRLAIAGLLGNLPADKVSLDDVTIVFRDDQCRDASGSVSLSIAAPLPGIGAVDYRGSPTCDGNRVRIVLAGPPGSGMVELFVQSEGEMRGRVRIAQVDAAAATALAAAGFVETPEGWILSVQGSL